MFFNIIYILINKFLNLNADLIRLNENFFYLLILPLYYKRLFYWCTVVFR